MNLKKKIAQIGLVKIFTMLAILLMSLTFVFVRADVPKGEVNQVTDYDGNLVYVNEPYIWKRTSTTEVYKNPDGTYTRTIGKGTINRDDKSKRYPYFVPFEDTINVTKENGKLKILDGVTGKECYIELEYQKKSALSISSEQFNINKTRGSWYFTSDVGVAVDSMRYNLNCSEFDVSFEDDALKLDNMKIDFKQAKIEQNISTTYDSKKNKLEFKPVSGKNADLRMIDPTITLQDADTENLKDAYVLESSPTSNGGSLDVMALDSVGVGDTDSRIYLSFNLSSINNFIYSVEQANLTLYQTDSQFANISFIELYSDWKNSTGNNILTESGITWNNQPCGTGISLNSTNCNVTSWLDYDTSSESLPGKIDFNLTSLVNKYKFSKNFSLMLKHLNETVNNEQIVFSSKEESTTSQRPKLEITYTPYIDIITPTTSQIFTEDEPTTYFNITTAVAMDSCHWSPDSGATNFSLTNVAGNNWTSENTSMVDGSHTITYSCNESSDGTWRTSDSVSFDVDSVNVTVCRDLTVARTYQLRNNITTGVDCFEFQTSDIVFEGNNFYIKGDGTSNLEGITDVSGDSKIQNTSFSQLYRGIFFNNGDNRIIVNSSFEYVDRGISVTSMNSGEFMNVSNCTFKNMEEWGLEFASPTSGGVFSFLEYNTFINATRGVNFEPEEGVREGAMVGGRYDLAVIRYNEFYNNTRENATALNLWSSGGSNGQIYGNYFDNNYYSIHFRSFTGGAIIRDNIITKSNSSNAISVADPSAFSSSQDINFINLTSDNYEVKFWGEAGKRNLTFQWYLSTQVNDTSGFLENANVTSYNNNGEGVASVLTNATGNIQRQELVGYKDNFFAKTYYNNYTINVTKDGYIVNSSSYNLTLEQNLDIFILMGLSDTTNPNIEILYPTNDLTIEGSSGIPLNFSANDTNIDTCWYNLKKSDGTFEITNFTTSCTANTTFDVSLYDTFNLTFYVNDTAGNMNSSQISFTIIQPSNLNPDNRDNSGGGTTPTFNKTLICDFAEQFLKEHVTLVGFDYSHDDIVNLTNLINIYSSPDIQVSTAELYLKNFEAQCDRTNPTYFKENESKTNFTLIKITSENITCSENINKKAEINLGFFILKYDMDWYIPFFKIDTGEMGCNSKAFWSWIFKYKDNREGYYSFVGFKLWWVLSLIILTFAWWFIIGRRRQTKGINKLIKRKLKK